jgi:hypothetical protein
MVLRDFPSKYASFCGSWSFWEDYGKIERPKCPAVAAYAASVVRSNLPGCVEGPRATKGIHGAR